MKSSIKFLFIFFNLMVILFGLSCQNSENRKSVLNYCTVKDAPDLSPHFASDLQSSTFARAVFSPLVRYDFSEKRWKGVLAEKVSVEDEGRLFRVQIRKDVFWHSRGDFVPSRNLNADDVVFTFQRMLDADHSLSLIHI